MKRGLTVAAGAVSLAATLAGSAITHLPVAQASESWTARTCAAYAAWAKHPSTANLDTMAADSFHISWRYVGQDAWGLYSDVRSGAAASYVAKDEKYFAEDC